MIKEPSRVKRRHPSNNHANASVMCGGASKRTAEMRQRIVGVTAVLSPQGEIA
jgi:hypothetical protein